jgi:hypothetical protein
MRVPLAVAFVLGSAALAAPADEAPCLDRAARPAQLVDNARTAGQSFAVTDLLQAKATVESSKDLLLRGSLTAGAVLAIDRPALDAFLKSAPKSVTLRLPAPEGGAVELELVKVDIFTPDFTVVTSRSKGRPVAVERGLHYRGVVKAVPGSLAAVSVFRDEVMGIYRIDDQAVVLGRLAQNKAGDHVLYAERDLRGSNKYTCDMPDSVPPDGTLPKDEEFMSFVSSQLVDPEPSAVLARCVRIYVEADNDLFRNKGSVSATTNYVTGLFNQSAILYSNDGVPISLSQVFVWDTTSPYTSSSSSGLLGQFQQFRNSFNGDLGHLLALRGSGGIAAGFNAFCNSNTDNRQCFSGINTTFNNVPTYSWSVSVFTHEMGHLMGSRHTHACVWNGNNTAIDGCAGRVEGTCALPGNPTGGGTIMSYCHLTNVGINFSRGFGPQPGNVIRTRFNNATCLTDCGGGGGGCSGGTTYTGTLSSGGQQFQPNGSWYQSTVSGTHSANLTGPASADFDLYLHRWNGSTWVTVAQSIGSTSTESVSYPGTAGYYRWRIHAYSGSGSYSVCTRRP